jgi:pimeloyl-ACP methyl ester carboxylesterase
VLLHGLASNRTRWSELVEQTSLAATHDLLTPDLRGHGAGSTVGDRGTLDRWVTDLANLLIETGHDRSVVVGHSLGAQVALHFAAEHPDRTTSLFLIDPVLRTALLPENQWVLTASPLFSAAAAAIRFVNGLGIHRRHIVPLDLRELDRAARIALQSPENAEAFIKQYSSTRADLKHIHTAQYLQDVVELLRPPPNFARIACPVRVLLSTGATFAGEAETQRDLSALKNVSFASIDCQHWPVTERPEEVRRAIEGWVASGFSHPAAFR